MKTQLQRTYDDVVTMYLLSQCDMHCKFCYASKDTGRLSLQEAKQIIDFFASIGAKRISLTGGEALMHPNVEEIIQHASNKNLRVNLFTSGSLLTPEKLERFAPYLRWLTLSLDGGNPELNESMGRRQGHFESVFRNLEGAKQVAPNVLVRVVTVVTKMNIGHLHEIGSLLIDSKVRPTWWRLKQMVALRSGKDMEGELGVTNEDFLTQINRLKNSFSDRLDVDGSLAISKSGDIMIIHPNGNCTATKFRDNEFQLDYLGNILMEPMATVEKWWELRDSENANFYQGIWARSGG